MSRITRLAASIWLTLIGQVSHAAIPKPTVPSGATETDILSVFVAYMKLALGIAVVAIGVYVFVVVASKIVKAFADWQNGKIEADRFLGSAFVGGLVVVIVGFLLYFVATYWVVNIVV